MQRTIYYRLFAAIVALGTLFALIWMFLVQYRSVTGSTPHVLSAIGIGLSVLLGAIVLIIADRTGLTYMAHHDPAGGSYLIDVEHPKGGSIPAFKDHFTEGEIVRLEEIVVLPVVNGKLVVQTAFKRKFQDDIIRTVASLS